jgi:MOSC domain-containing protein YiiM
MDAAKGRTMGTAKLVSIQVALPHDYPADAEEPGWTSAIGKQPVSGPVRLSRLNLAGDYQADQRVHGGPDQAVLAYAAAHYPLWRAELERPDFPYGAFGENFTVDGLDEGSVCLGDVYAVGGVVLEVTAPRGPCWKIARRHGIPDLTLRVQRNGRVGWYHRVLNEGDVQAGQELRLVQRPNPTWPMTRVSAVSAGRKRDQSELRELAAIPALSERQRTSFQRRLARAER